MNTYSIVSSLYSAMLIWVSKTLQPEACDCSHSPGNSQLMQTDSGELMTKMHDTDYCGYLSTLCVSELPEMFAEGSHSYSNTSNAHIGTVRGCQGSCLQMPKGVACQGQECLLCELSMFWMSLTREGGGCAFFFLQISSMAITREVKL